MVYYNHRTKITASMIGVLLGLTGFFGHGIFEVLQGSIATNGHMIEAVGLEQRFWLYGTQGAFTIIPNFLATGICAMLVSLAGILWSLKFIQTRHGASVFLVLFIMLTLVGGGIGHVIMFLPTWAYATRINKSLNWWKKRLSGDLGKTLSGLWIYCLVATAIAWSIEIELGVIGYFPGVSDPDAIMKIILAFLFLSVILANITFVCGFARDLDERNQI